MDVKFDDFKGCLYGLAIGDALGMPLEFKKREYRKKDGDIAEMVPGGWLGLPAGTWTDDTSMALCLAYSLLEKGFDAKDQLEKYTNWLDNGYLSCADKAIGSGKATRNAIANFKQTGALVNGDDNCLGNGSLMRLAPVPLYYLKSDAVKLFDWCVKSSETTHNSELCRNICALYGLDISMILKMKKNVWWNGVLKTSPFLKKENELGDTGHVQVTYENALYSIYNSDSFESALFLAVNLPGDSDTVGAVTGALAGALYGYSAIPQRWLKKLQKKDIIDDVVNRLWKNYNV